VLSMPLRSAVCDFVNSAIEKFLDSCIYLSP
jgi:hypothetical protein